MRALIPILILVQAAGAWGFQQPRIVVREQSAVKNVQFTLGEVAIFSGVDAHMQAKLSGVVLGTSPLPGLERTLTPEQIVTRLRQHGLRPEAFEMITPAKIVVRREAHLFRAQQAVEVAAQKVREGMPPGEEARIVCDSPLRDLSLPNSNVQVLAGEPRVLGAGLYLVPVQVRCEEIPPITLPVRLRVSRWREVLVARRAIHTGEVIDNDMVAVQRLALDTEDADLMTDPAEALGKVARRPVAIGQPVKRSAIDDPAVIRRGQNVKLLVLLRGAVIETTAIALQDGKAGARIRVQVVDTRKTLLATVVDAETATVDIS
jgi:flagella basal body P-ring formation protein FlgA